MSIFLVDTKELRKTGLLMQAWSEGMQSRESLMSSARLLDALPSAVRDHCAWGTVGGEGCSASVESLGGEFEARLTSSGDADSDSRRNAGVVVGMMTEMGNKMRFDNKPVFDDGAFRAPDGREVKYRVAAVPTKGLGDEHCGWIAVGDWAGEVS